MSALPAELPRIPEGWTQRLVSELKHGGKAVTSSYDMIAPDGSPMPFTFALRIGADGAIVMRGYFLEGRGEALTWAQLRELWPDYVRSKK